MKYLNKRTSWIFLLFMIGFSSAFAQDARVMLQFEDAEKAFNAGNYEATLKHLGEVEKSTGVTSKTLYLRIVAESALFDNGVHFYEDKNQFELLQRVRQNTDKYLKSLSEQGLDDKYRRIYRISENLKLFPNDFKEWEEKHKEVLLVAEEKQKEELRLVEEKQEGVRLKQLAEKELEPLTDREKVQYVLDKYIAAAGGEKMKSLTSISKTYTEESEYYEGKQYVGQQIFTNGKYKKTTSFSGKEITKSVIKGTKGYTINLIGPKPKKRNFAVSSQLKIYLEFFPEFRLRSESGVNFEGIEDFSGKIAYVIKEKLPKNKKSQENAYKYYYYDLITNLKIGTKVSAGDKYANVTTYEDYKDYEGIKLPLLEVDGGVIFTRTTELKFNETYTDADFK